MNPDNFIKGKVYFMCSYETPSGLIPRVEALVYLGKNLHEKESEDDEYYFQDPQVYFIDEVTIDYVRKDILSSGLGELIIPADSIHSIKNYDELITVVNRDERFKKVRRRYTKNKKSYNTSVHTDAE